MKDKITLPILTQMLALRTGDTKKQAEDFLKEFFGLVSTTLVEGEQVKIKDIGVFKTVEVEARKSVNVSTGADHEIPAHRKVSFVPSKEMAARVNEPFEMFETVELNDDEPEELSEYEIPEEQSEEFVEPEPRFYKETIVETEPIAPVEPPIDQLQVKEETLVVESEEVESEEATAEDQEELEEEAEEPEEDKVAVEDQKAAEKKVSASSVELYETSDEHSEGPVEEPTVETDSDGEPVTVQTPAKSRFWTGFLCGFLLAALFGGVGYVWMKYPGFNFCKENIAKKSAEVVAQVKSAEVKTDNDSVPAQEAKEETEPVKKVAETQQQNEAVNSQQKLAETAPTEPSDAPVYDYITKTRYLTTMAKDHYGNYHLWPYIYYENSSFIGHPDRIKPGTRIRIPDLKKYGVDPTSKRDIEIAKKKGIEIYSRYK